MNEMTVILAKEEDGIKNGKAISVSMVTDQEKVGQKKKFPPKNSGGNKHPKKKGTRAKPSGHSNTPSSSGTKKDDFHGKCNFCCIFGHKKADCCKFKAWLEQKKGNNKQRESN